MKKVLFSKIEDIEKYIAKDHTGGHIKIENVSIEMLIDWNKSKSLLDKIGMELLTKNLTSKTLDFNSNIKVVQLTKDRSTQLLEETLRDSFLDRMSYLSVDERDNYQQILKSSALEGRVFSFEINQQSIGLLITREIDHDNEAKTLISWIWTTSKLSKQEKNNFKLELANTLKKYSHNKIVAAVHFENTRSISFFKKMGFKAIWISSRN